MAVAKSEAGAPSGAPAFSTGENDNPIFIILRLLGIALFDAFAIIIVYAFLGDNNIPLALAFGIVAVVANIIFFVPGLYPLRWMAPGLLLMALFVVYPLISTIVTAFTNYGDGHLLTKQQSIDLIEQRRFVPEDARTYSWTIFQNESGESALWLTRETDDGQLEAAFAPVGAPIQDIENPPTEAPASYEGYTQLPRAESVRALSQVQDAVFGEGEDTAAISGRNAAARPLEQRYVYNPEENTVLDQESGLTYRANDEVGEFQPLGAADNLTPGYRVNIGLGNFQRLIEDSDLLEPLLQVFLWTVVFSLLSVLTTFAMGLLMALVLDDPNVPARKLWRSMIFIPYAIPGVISILVWQGMLNQNLGIITTSIADLTGYTIPWFESANWARFAIILVNLWLGYPYMMLICSGALQAIPSDVYEAAAVDGANSWQSFWRITLPLLLITVGPLLIASFTFNFNNYLLIEALTGGDPPIPGTPTPAGRTDILISYTYNLAFGGDTGADYGYAAAITIVIFAVVGAITLYNTRFLAQLEEVNG